MNKILNRTFSIMLALVIAITLASCGGNSSAVEKDIKTQFEVIQKTFTDLGESVKKGDTSMLASVPQFATVASKLENSPEAWQYIGNIFAMMGETEVSVSDIKESGDKATAKLKIKSYDISAAMQKAGGEIGQEASEMAKQGKSQEEMEKVLLAKIFELTEKNAKADGKKAEKEINAELVKTGGKWMLSPNVINELNSVFSGGF